MTKFVIILVICFAAFCTMIDAKPVSTASLSDILFGGKYAELQESQERAKAAQTLSDSLSDLFSALNGQTGGNGKSQSYWWNDYLSSTTSPPYEEAARAQQPKNEVKEQYYNYYPYNYFQKKAEKAQAASDLSDYYNNILKTYFPSQRLSKAQTESLSDILKTYFSSQRLSKAEIENLSDVYSNLFKTYWPTQTGQRLSKAEIEGIAFQLPEEVRARLLSSI